MRSTIDPKQIEMEMIDNDVTELIRPYYQVFTPSCVGDFEQQWRSCFESLQHILKGDPNRKAFVLRIFIDANDDHEYRQRVELVGKFCSTIKVPIGVVAQSPEKPSLVIIEAGFVSDVQVEYGLAGTLKYSRLSMGSYSEYWFPGVYGEPGGTISDSANSAFRKLHLAFDQLGLGFDHIVRQWNYVENIFNFTTIEGELRQNYQLFNEVRKHYYSNYLTVSEFPAATGVGAGYGGVTIDCVAVKGNTNLKIIPVSNPKQIDAFQYGQSVLKGVPSKHLKTNQTPLFERAKLMNGGSNSRIFISGTASIVGQETIGLNDVKQQTLVTIENIELLTSESNLKAHCPELSVLPNRYSYVRVYVKLEDDLPTVRNICQDFYGDVPLCIVKADICRSDLLVEIEAEKIFHCKTHI